MKKPANQLTATEAVTLISEGKLTAEKLVRACIERIDAREKDVGAWTYFNEAQAIEQARARDQNPSRGLLHGIPVGVKDIIDTVDMPTEYGTPIYAGNQPHWDAACVNAVRHAGGIILGKTVTTELAYFGPGKTRNPLKLNHTPGGSSSGSAAAVADCMVPLAFGTQTGGSTLRPAAFCGIVGFKPTFNLINRAGVKSEAESLDTIGIMARCVADAALFTAAVTDRFYLRNVRPADGALRIGLCHTYEWRHALPETAAALEHVAYHLAQRGAQVKEIKLPPEFAELLEAQKIVQAYEAARAYGYEWREHRARLSPKLKELLRDGYAATPATYDKAQATGAKCRALMRQIFRDYDVLLAPSTPGEAPQGLESTGSPVFNSNWTFLHTPAITLPVGAGPGNLPLGVQLVGRMHDDARLLSAAAWVEQQLRG